MKSLLLSLAAAALAATGFAAEAAPVFNAVLTTGKDHRFVLLSSAGKTSSFLRVGESFEGYVVKAYDAKADTLTVERDGQSVQLRLVADAAIGNAPAATPATLADATALLQAMNFDEMMDKTLAGIRKQQKAMVEQMMGRMAPPGASAEERASVVEFQKKVMDEMMSSLSGAEMRDDMAKVYSEVFTREELQSLAGFYASPIGKTFSDKQPELAEKMNAVMAPRMMAAMPKVQQMMREFGAEMRAKKAAAAAATGTAPAPVAPTPTPAPK